GRGLAAQAVRASEYDVKAVFLFNFAQFVEWPAEAFPEADTPLVIGVLGDDPFGRVLDQTVGDERLGGRRFQIRRYHSVDEIKTCHILFVSRPEGDRPQSILAGLKNRPIKRKLTAILLLISGLVLVLTSAAFVTYQVVTFRGTMQSHLATRSRILAANSTAALAFANEADATEILAALKYDPHMVAAALYNQDGRVLATY